MTIPWGVLSSLAVPMGAAYSSVMHPQPSCPGSSTQQIPAVLGVPLTVPAELPQSSCVIQIPQKTPPAFPAYLLT